MERSLKLGEADNKMMSLANKQHINHKRVKSDVPDMSQINKKGGPIMSVPTSLNGNNVRMNKKVS
jgi:hypothetical protein